MRQAPERLTWDATYQGLPLTRAAYDAHLLMLDQIAAGRTINVCSLDALEQHEAWVDIKQGGLVRTRHLTSSDVSYEHHLTPLGETYVRQRRDAIEQLKQRKGATCA